MNEQRESHAVHEGAGVASADAVRFTFTRAGDHLTGVLYLPSATPTAAVVTTGPLTSVKEQAVGAYAAALVSGAASSRFHVALPFWGAVLIGIVAALIAGVLFGALVVGVILIVGALTFFPAYALGPIVEQLLMLAGKTF